MTTNNYLGWNTKIVDDRGFPTPEFMRYLLGTQENIPTDAVPDSRKITGSNGVTGGGDLTQDRVLSLTDTPVTPGTYGDATHSAQVTVDQKGRLTAATQVAIAGGGGGGGGGRVPITLGTLRPLSDFVQVNLGGSQYVTEYAGKAFSIRDDNPAPTTTRCYGLTRPAPAGTPYRVASFIQYNTVAFQYNGFCWGYEDASGKIMHMAYHGGDNNFGFSQYSNPNTRVNYTGLAKSYVAPITGIWVAWRYDGTTCYFEVSADGANFTTVGTYTVAGGYLADVGKLFIGIDALAYAYSGVNNNLSMSILDWNENALVLTPGGTGAGGGGTPKFINVLPYVLYNSSTSAAPGYWIGNGCLIEQDCTIDAVCASIFTPGGSLQATPAIYSDTGSTGLGVRVAVGPTITGLSFGLNVFPLTTPLIVAKGTYLWIGFQDDPSTATFTSQSLIQATQAYFPSTGTPTAGVPTGVNYGTSNSWNCIFARTT